MFAFCRKKTEHDESCEEGEVKEEELHPLASVTNINPDEIPDVPVNKFLYRGGAANNDDKRGPRQRGEGFVEIKCVL